MRHSVSGVAAILLVLLTLAVAPSHADELDTMDLSQKRFQIGGGFYTPERFLDYEFALETLTYEKEHWESLLKTLDPNDTYDAWRARLVHNPRAAFLEIRGTPDEENFKKLVDILWMRALWFRAYRYNWPKARGVRLTWDEFVAENKWCRGMNQETAFRTLAECPVFPDWRTDEFRARDAASDARLLERRRKNSQ